MMRTWHWRAAIPFGLVCFAGASSSVPVQAKPPAGLVFEAFPVQDKIPLGKPIYLRFQLRNTGTRNALVNRRFYLNDVVSLEVTGPSGQHLSWCGYIFQLEVSHGDFVFLAPGAHVGRVVQVSYNERKTVGYTFAEPGQYVIRAQYQLPFPDEVLAKAAHGAIVVKGPIPANPIRITLVPPK